MRVTMRMCSGSMLLMLLSALADPAKAYDCFDAAGSYHGVRPTVLRAIAKKENSRCDATISRNKNGSIDVGCMQINSIHFKELANYGVKPADLMDQCKNIFTGAWHYKKMIHKYGDTWQAVGAYHSENPKYRDPYAADVYRILQRSHAQF